MITECLWNNMKIWWHYKHRFSLQYVFLAFSPVFMSFTSNSVFFFQDLIVSVTLLLKTSIWFLIICEMKSNFVHGFLPTSWCDLAQLSLRLLKGPIPSWIFSHFICVSSIPQLRWPSRCSQLKSLPPYYKYYSLLWLFRTTRSWGFLLW